MLSERFILGCVFSASLACAWPVNKRQGSYTQSKLQFTSDGTFQISIFEDLHYGESKSTDSLTFRDGNSVVLTFDIR